MTSLLSSLVAISSLNSRTSSIDEDEEDNDCEKSTESFEVEERKNSNK